MIYLDYFGIFIDFVIKLCYLEINEATNKKNDVPPLRGSHHTTKLLLRFGTVPQPSPKIKEVIMKGSKKGRFKLFAVVLFVGGVLGLIVAQQALLSPTEEAQEKEKQRPLLASDKKPPEIEKLEKEKAPPVKERKQPSVKELLEKVRKQPGGKEKIEKAKAGKPGKKTHRASDKKPPEIEKLEKEKAPPVKERKQPSVKELLEKVRKQPGGKEKIEAAKKSGAKIGTASDGRGSSSWLDSFNLFKPKALYAQSSTSVTLTPRTAYVSTPFLCYMYIYGVMRGHLANYSSRETIITHRYSSLLGTTIDNPYICLAVNAPSTGWYLINFETFYGSQVSLKHYHRPLFETIQTWNQSGAEYFDYPAVVYLSAGRHYFYWIVESGSWPWFFRVTVTKI